MKNEDSDGLKEVRRLSLKRGSSCAFLFASNTEQNSEYFRMYGQCDKLKNIKILFHGQPSIVSFFRVYINCRGCYRKLKQKAHVPIIKVFPLDSGAGQIASVFFRITANHRIDVFALKECSRVLDFFGFTFPIQYKENSSTKHNAMGWLGLAQKYFAF